jgi:SH3-like domain-containing protein
MPVANTGDDRGSAMLARRAGWLLLGLAAIAVPASAAKEPVRVKAPAYYASITAAKARMRTGPGRNFPAIWLYVRPGLPVRVLETFEDWRKVEDPGGTQGWIQSTLIGKARSAIVTAAAPIELRDRPAGGQVLWRAAPGVVGKVTQCANGWCRLDVNGQAGFTPTSGLWGVEPGETLP